MSESNNNSPEQEAIARLQSVFNGMHPTAQWSRAHTAELFQRYESQSSRIAALQSRVSELEKDCRRWENARDIWQSQDMAKDALIQQQSDKIASLQQRIVEITESAAEKQECLDSLKQERAALRERCDRFVIDTCDMGHQFAKLDGKKTRCPECLAIGLERARVQKIRDIEQEAAEDERRWQEWHRDEYGIS